jgi:hypothetical protein
MCYDFQDTMNGASICCHHRTCCGDPLWCGSGGAHLRYAQVFNTFTAAAMDCRNKSGNDSVIEKATPSNPPYSLDREIHTPALLSPAYCERVLSP